MRPEDVFERRLRGGSRPGLAKYSPTLIGSGNPVRLLNTLRSSDDSGVVVYEDQFSGTALTADWTTPTWVRAGLTWNVPTVSDGFVRSLSIPGAFAGQVHNNSGGNITTASGSSDQVITAKINASSSVYIYALLNDSVPDLISNGLQVRFIRNTGAGPGRIVSLIESFNSSSYGGNTASLYSVTTDEVKIIISANNVVTVYWGTPFLTPIITYNLVASPRSGQTIGFAFDSSNDGNIDWLKFEYQSTTAGIAPVSAVSSSNGVVYTESGDGSMEAITGQAMDLASDRLLSSDERFGKLYIADYGVRVSGTDGTITGSGTSFTFDDAAAKVWTDAAYGIDKDGDYIELMFGGTGTYTPGVYIMSAFSATTVTLTSPTILAAQTGVAIPYRILRGTKIFDYRVATGIRLSLLTRTTGTAINPPVGCKIAAIWQDRLVLSGDPENPGDVFMSKQGDPKNWSEDDTLTSPVFGDSSTNSRVGKPVTALIPFVRDYLVIGTKDSINVLRGNPISGAQIDSISRVVGIVDKHAWCMTPENVLIVLTGDGLYAIGPDAAIAMPMSRDKLPQELSNLDTMNSDVQLAFDVRRNGIAIAITPTTTGTSLYYWFDWTTKSYWPETYHNDHQPTAMVVHQSANETTPILIYGGRDGYLRKFSDESIDDDGTAFTSHVLIGPIQLGGSGYGAGMLREIVGQLSTLSGTVTCEIQVGDSIESAYLATPRNAFTLRGGKSLSNFPRLRGNVCFLKLSTTNRWALEQLSTIRERFGKQRLFS